MYSKLFNRLRKSCHNVKTTARTVPSSSKTILSNNPKSSDAKFRPPSPQEESTGASSSSQCPTYGEDLLDADSSLDVSSCPQLSNTESLVKASSSSSSFSLSYNSFASKDGSDQYWIGIINSQPYKNWLKVGLALRSVCNFISPVLDAIVQEMHSNLLEKHGFESITKKHIANYKNNRRDSELLHDWIRDVNKLHRHPPRPGEIFRISNVEKWPTNEGAWEVARVFMSKGYRTGGDGVDPSAFDVSALLNFMYRCRLVDGYVSDFNSVKNVLQVRNNIMHNPMLQVDNNALEESFQIILALVQDPYLCTHAEKYISTEKYYQNLQEIKTASFDLMTSAKHSLSLLKDDAFDPNCNLGHPSPRTLVLLKDVLPRILSLPHVEVSADFSKLQSQIAQMEEKVAKEYEEAEKKIKTISSHVLHMTQKLDHLRQLLTESKPNTTSESSPELAPKRKRKRQKDLREAGTSTNYNREKPYPAGSLTNQSLLATEISEDGQIRLKSKGEKRKTQSENPFAFGASCSACSDDSGSECDPSNAQPKVQPTSSKQRCRRKKETHRVSGHKRQHHEQFNNGSNPTSSSRSKRTLKRKKSSNKQEPVASGSISSLFEISQLSRPMTSKMTSEDQESCNYCGNCDGNEPQMKRFKNESVNKGQKKNRAMLKELLSTPNKKKKGGNRRGDGGKGRGLFCSKLQSFLKKQPNNDGATFTTRLDSNNRYFSSVSFQSLYAVSSPVISATEEEAEQQAALEACRRVVGTGTSEDMDLFEAKIWFDQHAKNNTGKTPNYTCSEANTELYTSCVHLINNKLFPLTDTMESHKIFVEATCTTMNPDVDVEEAAVKSALQGSHIVINDEVDLHNLLNEYCLDNDATLPVFLKTSAAHPKTRKVSRSCTLRSFLKKYLSEEISPEEHTSGKSDPFNFLPLFSDFLQAYSSRPQSSRALAEDSAGMNMLSMMSFTDMYLSQIRGSCKAELEAVAEDMDLSIAYHTTKVQRQFGNHSPKKYFTCVVTSPCLAETRDSFTVTSDKQGQDNEEEACESAARNALMLLGMEVVLTG